MFMGRIAYSRRTLWLCLASLGAIILLVSLTSPASNILMGLIFFILALIFLISLSYLLLGLGGRKIGRRGKLTAVVISVFVILGLMFMSVQSLNWATGLTLVLLAFGMLFYTSRRS